ncbi:MAG: response regulator [Massilia sp.]|nr:response regulator [Massilia sp.]
MRRILLVDDEVNVLNALVRALRQQLAIDEVQIEAFSNPLDALQRCCECNFDIVISDYRMPELSGIDLLHTLKEIAPCTVRMMLSASTEFDTVRSAIAEAQVFRYIAKPWHMPELLEAIRQALVQRDALLEQQLLVDQQRRRRDALRTPQQIEAALLDEEEPGMLDIKWGPNGEIML